MSDKTDDRARRDGGASSAQGPAGQRRVSLAARVYGVLCILDGIVKVPFILMMLGILAYLATHDPALLSEVVIGDNTQLTLVLLGIYVAIMLVVAVLVVALGVALLRSRRRRVHALAVKLIVLAVVELLIDIMLEGIGANLIGTTVQLIVLIALSVTIDPSLRAERAARRIEEERENAEAEAEGMEGRDLTGKGYMDLNFFNLFWEFVVCCVLGLVLEIIWHFVVVEPGAYQDRAGLLFGPFSPIYGFGAVLVTLALNRLYDKNPIIIFVVSAIVGGGFEYLTSLFMELSFGVTAWDYSDYTILGMPDPIAVACDGRTSTMFVCMWGVLGFVWVKALLPLLLRFINLIPWKLRYGLTTVCAALMLVNGVMTLESLDCWFERVSGVQPTTPVERFYAEHYDNAFMEHRFQSMTIAPESSTRLADGAAAETR